MDFYTELFKVDDEGYYINEYYGIDFNIEIIKKINPREKVDGINIRISTFINEIIRIEKEVDAEYITNNTFFIKDEDKEEYKKDIENIIKERGFFYKIYSDLQKTDKDYEFICREVGGQLKNCGQFYGDDGEMIFWDGGCPPCTYNAVISKKYGFSSLSQLKPFINVSIEFNKLKEWFKKNSDINGLIWDLRGHKAMNRVNYIVVYNKFR